MKERKRASVGEVWRYPGQPDSKVERLNINSEMRLIAHMVPVAQRRHWWKVDSERLEAEGTLIESGSVPQMPVEMIEPPPEPRRHSHYFRNVAHLQEIDIYRVLELFGVTDQALGHAAKKIMMPGLRGAKATRKDIEEAIDTLQRRLEMMDEDDRRQNAAAPTPPARIDGKGRPSLDHSELRKTWAPGQRWQYRFEEQPEWRNCMDGDSPVDPNWFPNTEYRRHPDDVPAVLSPSPTRAPLHWGHTGDASDVTAYRQPPAAPTPPAPWYPDDSGAWVEVPDTTSTCPCDPDAIVEVLVREERETKRFCSAPRVAKISHWDHDPQSRCRIVAYRKVPRV